MRHDHHDTHKKIPDTNAHDTTQEITTRAEQLKTGDNTSAEAGGHDENNPDSGIDGRSRIPTSNPRSTNANPTTKRPTLSHFHQDSEDHFLDRHRHNLAILRLAGRDGGGSMSGFNSLAPSEDEREEAGPRPRLHQPRPSQDIGNDGDDEGSESKPVPQRLRRARSHNHHHHHHYHNLYHLQSANMSKRSLAVRIGDALGDRDPETDDTDHLPNDRETSLEPEPEPAITKVDQDQKNEDDALEAERRMDQSIRGSVY